MLSVVIPTLNESSILSDTVLRTRRAAIESQLEIIISDCGSQDRTVDLAAGMPNVDQVIIAGRSRADALNRGARRARGDVLLFLHADSCLPLGFDRLISRTLMDRGTVGGAFDFEFATPSHCSRIDRRLLDCVVRCKRVRCRWTGDRSGARV